MILRQIEYLQAVVECGSFHLAAQQCHVSQSAISQQIKKLEDELRKKYSGIVYHYCSLDTFLKLLQIIQSEHQIYENRMITMK